MSNERRNRAREIFLASLRLHTPHERAEAVARECGEDAVLQSAVVNLIEAHEENDDFLEDPFDGLLEERGNPSSPPLNQGGNGDIAATIDMPPAAEQASSKIGPYKLLQQIGEGGFGVVYMAEQTKPVRRKVALKIIKAGMDTKEVIARFEAERQALALMDHPSIAKVLDAGTTGEPSGVSPRRQASDDLPGLTPPGSPGRPYFVMELVHGVPITKYCDDNKLSTRERLQLFVDVCRAVQHAHQKGVVHRDLKPSNVLITMNNDKPMPKVIDFGVSKALSQQLTEKTLFTAYGHMVGTPMYMSPEQAQFSAQDVDTRSDVYSLGVLLYKLLTGHTPFNKETLQNSGFDEMRRLIREVDPPRPSARISTLQAEALSTVSDRRKIDPRKFGQSLRGELDWIVMKALEKDRNRRYESASAFAADVERYLADEPVQACPPSVGYKLRKLFGRHRAALMTALLVLAAIVAGAGFSVWHALQAGKARRLADDRRGIADAERAKAEQAVAQFGELLYVADMKLASDAIAANDSPRAAELLQRHTPEADASDKRGFEWHFYNKQVTQAPVVSLDQGAPVYDVELSPDGKWLAVGTKAGIVRVYGTATWNLYRSFNTGRQQVNGVGWSPEGNQLAAACQDGNILVWNFSSGNKQRAIPAHIGGTNDVGFSLDGRHLYSCGNDHLVKTWNLDTGTQQNVFKKHKREVERLALSSDGKTLATASSDCAIALWNARTSECLHHINPYRSRVVCIAFSDNGQIVAAGDIAGRVSLIDARTGNKQQLPRQLDGVEALTFFQGGKWLATADRGGAIQLHAVPDELLSEFRDSPPRSQPLRWVAHEGRALALARSRDGKSLVSGGRDGVVRVWAPDFDALRWYTCSDPGSDDFAIAPDNRLYLTGRSLSVWDLERRRLIETIAPDRPQWKATACSADGRFLAAAGARRLVLFDAASQQVLREWPLDEKFDPHRLAISPDGRSIAIAGSTGEAVLVFNRDASKKLREYPASQCRCLAFSPDGRRLAAGHMDDLRLFDLRGPGSFRTFNGHTSTLSDACFSPDGKLLATVSHDRLLKIWALAVGKERFSIVAHRDWVKAVAFTPDGRTIATGGDDGQVRFWHSATGQPLGVLPKETAAIYKLRFSRDGARLVAQVGKAKLAVYDASSRSHSKTESASSKVTAEFQGLGDLPGGLYKSTVNGLSGSGKYVVGHSRTNDGFQGFCWSQDDGLVGYPPSIGKNSHASAVSDDGRIVCGSGHSSRRGWCAQIWIGRQQSRDIAHSWSHAVDTTSNGAVVIGNRWSKGRERAFRYAAGETKFLPQSPKHKHVQAVAITAQGDLILGRVYNTAPVPGRKNLLVSQHIRDARPVLWKTGRLRLLPGFNKDHNWWPCDISDDGSVIVGVSWPIGYNFFTPTDHRSGVAFRWESGRVTFLGSLPNHQHSRPFAVSGDGRVVVGVCYRRTKTSLSLAGFIWDARQRLRSLSDVLRRANADISGWEIHQAIRISRDGGTIAGNGTNPQGNVEAWIARLPRDVYGKTTIHPRPPDSPVYKHKADSTQIAAGRNSRRIRAVKPSFRAKAVAR